MHYDVQMTPTAEVELLRCARYIHDRDPQNAIRWLQGIDDAIDSLELFPLAAASRVNLNISEKAFANTFLRITESSS